METTTSRQSLPVLYIQAESHYEVGMTIGTAFKGWINQYLDDADDVALFRRFYATDAGREIYERYLTTTKSSFPKLFNEIQGIADGASVPFHDIFLLQISSEILFCHGREIVPDGVSSDTPSPDKGCTDLLVNKECLRVIAHNDDWDDDISKRVYMVHVTISQNDVIEEQYLSYMYPGFLAGFTFAVTGSLVITLNTVRPKRAEPRGVPLLVLLRATLACKSVAECQTMMENKPNGCAYGMNLNIATVDGAEMCSMEVYPAEGGSLVTIHDVPYVTSGGDKVGFYHHENMYKHTTREQQISNGSQLRAARVNTLGEPGTIDDIKIILGDTLDPLEPIYRVPGEGKLEKTVKTTATAIIDVGRRRLDVYRDNPKSATRPLISMPFPFLP